MGREIKFRGKRKDNNQWIYGSLLQHSGRFEILVSYSDNVLDYDIHIIKPETVGEFTGLKDKNGIEIFEGNIIKIVFKDNRDGQIYINPSFIIWSNINLGWVLPTVKDAEHGLPLNWGGYESLEVIGNIHENPELI